METILLAVTLWCSNVDLNKVDYCRDEVMECLNDEGLRELGFCLQDYLDVNGIESMVCK